MQQDMLGVGQEEDNNDGDVSDDYDLTEDNNSNVTLYQLYDNYNTDYDDNGGEDDNHNCDNNDDGVNSKDFDEHEAGT